MGARHLDSACGRWVPGAWTADVPAGASSQAVFRDPRKTRCNSLAAKGLSKAARFYVVSGGMARKLRYIPEGGALVEVTCRTLQGRLLLRPSPELNDITAAILGRAQRLYPVEIVAFQALSNHYLCGAAHKENLSRRLAPC